MAHFSSSQPRMMILNNNISLNSNRRKRKKKNHKHNNMKLKLILTLNIGSEQKKTVISLQKQIHSIHL